MDARYLKLRPPLHDGGHGFVLVVESGQGDLFNTYTGPPLWRCTGCHRYLPQWALTEGYVTTMLGRWCPGLFEALPPGPEHST